MKVASSSITGIGAISDAQVSPNNNQSADLQNTFLTLLIAQLQNQDPTNPADSSQLTQQLAEINTVSGIAEVNSTLNSVLAQLNAAQGTQVAALVGKTVLVPGNTVTVADGKSTGFGIRLDQNVADLKVNILDANGQTVATLDLGAASAGVLPVSWTATANDGRAIPDGTYTINVNSSDGAQPPGQATLSTSVINAIVHQSDGSAGLVLSDGSTVKVSNLAAIIRPLETDTMEHHVLYKARTCRTTFRLPVSHRECR